LFFGNKKSVDIVTSSSYNDSFISKKNESPPLYAESIITTNPVESISTIDPKTDPLYYIDPKIDPLYYHENVFTDVIPEQLCVLEHTLYNQKTREKVSE
jgi:hypothetical protein